MKKNTKTFKQYLAEIEDPKNDRGVNRSLPKKANSLEVAKFELCKEILAYQIKNNLDDKQLMKQLDLSLAETEDILFCEIEKFTLDRLMVYAGRLFSPIQIKITTKEKNASHVREI